MSANSVFIIILNWNSEKDTIDCLSSIGRLNYSNYRIVLVDNCSKDNSAENIKSWFVRHKNCEVINDKFVVEYNREQAESGGVVEFEDLLLKSKSLSKLVFIQNEENLGFAGGCNVGIRYALRVGAKYIWLLNNDTIVEPGSLTSIVDFLDNNKEFVGASCQIRYHHNKSMVWNCGGHLSIFGSRKYDYSGANISVTPQFGWKQITFITGCAFLLKSSLLEANGLLTEKFFFGEEDIEFCYRLKQNHKKIACVYDSIIYHRVGSSTGGRAAPFNIGKVYIYFLNRFINLKGFMPKAIWFLWRFVAIIYIVPMLMIRYNVKWSLVLKITRLLFKESSKLDSVNRDVFISAIDGTFLEKM